MITVKTTLLFNFKNPDKSCHVKQLLPYQLVNVP